MSETLSIPVEIHETQYSLVSYGKGTTEFECDHIHTHCEQIDGEWWEKVGELSHEYKVLAYICDECDEVIENVAVEECES